MTPKSRMRPNRMRCAKPLATGTTPPCSRGWIPNPRAWWFLLCSVVHEDDLAGRLMEKGGWEHLKVQAIAESDERIPIGGRRLHRRKMGDVIDPQGDTLEALLDMKRSMGELYFSAQYQQE